MLKAILMLIINFRDIRKPEKIMEMQAAIEFAQSNYTSITKL